MNNAGLEPQRSKYLCCVLQNTILYCFENRMKESVKFLLSWLKKKLLLVVWNGDCGSCWFLGVFFLVWMLKEMVSLSRKELGHWWCQNADRERRMKTVLFSDKIYIPLTGRSVSATQPIQLSIVKSLFLVTQVIYFHLLYHLMIYSFT